jgi:hypothetical protein
MKKMEGFFLNYYLVFVPIASSCVIFRPVLEALWIVWYMVALEGNAWRMIISTPVSLEDVIACIDVNEQLIADGMGTEIPSVTDTFRLRFIQLKRRSVAHGSGPNPACPVRFFEPLHVANSVVFRTWRGRIRTGVKCHSVSITQCFLHCLVNTQKQARHVPVCPYCQVTAYFVKMYIVGKH